MPGPPTSNYQYFCSRFLKIYFLDLLYSRAHIFRTLFNIQAGEGSCLDGT